MEPPLTKTIDNTVRRWEEKFKTEEDFKGDKWHKNNTGTISAILLLLCIGDCSVGMAQQPITLKSAIDSAIHNNLLVKNEQLKAKYQQMLIHNKAVLPKMGITEEEGQINSIYND